MPTPPMLHAIGTGFIIALLVGLFMYGLFMSEITMINNYTALLQYISDRVAASIRALYSSTYLSNSNKSSISLNLPVEISSEKGYNVYIGRGLMLAKDFPRILERPDYNPQAFYVVASTPDKKVYSITLLFQPSDLVTPLNLAKGAFIVERVKEGFDPLEGYSEGGVLWLCRMPLYVAERAGVGLSSYLIKVEFNPSIINCSYLDSTYYPRKEDVRFADSDGVSTLRYWIETWSPNYTRIWVEIPSLKPLENKTIYLYWGNPNAQDRSDAGIFVFYDEFSKYESLNDLLSINSPWSIRPSDAKSYNIIPSQQGALLTSLFDPKRNGSLIIYYNKVISLSYPQGILIESLGRPYGGSDKDVEYMLGLVNVGDASQIFNVSLRPTIIDPSLNLSNYTVIYGNWSIDSRGNDTFLNLTSLDYIESKGYYGIALRNNSAGSYPGGLEYFQTLYKIRVDNTGAVRGILVSESPNLNTSRGFYIGLQYNSYESRLYAYLADVKANQGIPDMTAFSILNSTYFTLVEPQWLILYVWGRSPGQANPDIVFQVINPTDGSVLLTGNKTLQGGLQPNYIGPFVLSQSNVEDGSQLWFDDLLSSRYSSSELFDLKKLFILGLPPGWEIQVIDYKDVEVQGGNTTLIEKQAVYSANATSNDYGVATFDLTLYPILGEKYPVEFLFYYNGELVDRAEYNGLLSGGMVLVFRPYLKDPRLIDGGLIFTLKGKTGSEIYYYVKDPGNGSLVQTNTPAGWHVSSIGYFNNRIYYFVVNQTTYIGITNLTFSYSTPLSNLTFFIGLMIYYSTGQTSVNLTGLYTWIRARPFVYPEPSVRISYFSESLSIPQPPDVRIVEYVDTIVFSSELLVDFFMIIRSDSQYVLTIVFKGKRA